MPYNRAPKEELKTSYYAKHREEILARLEEKRRLKGPPEKKGRKLGIRSKRVYVPKEVSGCIPGEPRSDEYNQKRPKLHKDYALQRLGGVCTKCGNDDKRVLEFDHIDPSQKKYQIHYLIQLANPQPYLDQELDKCQILCANCHRIKSIENKELGRSSIKRELSEHKVKLEKRVCPNCQIGFQQRSPRHKFCSDYCRRKSFTPS